MRGQTLGLEKHLVSVAIGKAMDLVLDAWTISRAGGPNRTRKQGRTMEIGANDVVTARIGAGDGAEELRVSALRRQRRDRPVIGIRWLLFQHGPVDRSPIQTGRSTGFEPGHREIDLAQLLC